MGFRPAVLAALAGLLLFWLALLPAVAQAPAGHLEITTDYEMFGTTELRGGGHVTWTLTGGEAADLRRKILHLFDEYLVIPQGFAFTPVATNGDRDGRLDPAEGVRYTDLVEVRLEASGGTSAQYLVMYPFDLREKNPDPATGFNRSTAGLAGRDANSTEDVVIRFLFEANNTISDGQFPLATRALADALYSGFSYAAVQSPTLTPSGPYPGTWPFLAENGWHVVTNVSGHSAFWPGNDLTGQYDINADASSGSNAGLPGPPMPFDLRFASRAIAEFRYTGQVADSNDFLLLERAHPATNYTDWQALPFEQGARLPSTAPGVWEVASVNLTPLLGEQFRLRLRFQSDTTGIDSGFYVRDFALRAPSEYEGLIVESDWHYLIGTLSFSEPAVTAGGIHVIRTPGGEIATYGAAWDAAAMPSDAMRFRTYDVAESPQILFGVMLVACYAISRMQESAYERYRQDHPAEYRPAVPKAKWLHRSGKVAIAVLILFYFVPTATWVLGLRVFVSGPAYWFLALALAAGLGLGTRAYYRRKLGQAPPPAVGEEPVLVRKVLVSPPPPDDRSHPMGARLERTVPPASITCASCGDLQIVPDGADARIVTCGNCGSRLRHLDAGKRYLILASNPAIGFTWLKDLTRDGKPALCLTVAAPERLRLEYGADDATILQVSTRAANAIDPRRLDPVGLRAILPLGREAKGGVLMYDGMDQMIADSSIGDVVRFLRKANDMAFVHGVTVIARVGPGRLAVDELKRLNAEFDETLDLSAHV